MSITGIFGLDWALVGVSVFNTILQLWLGLTVLLNAERRSWGVWVMGGGLLAGAAFFISHTAILGQELFFSQNLDGLDFWWKVGWIPVIIAPFAWYMVVLWYVGYWRDRDTRLHRRHRWWLLVALDMIVGLAFLMIFAHPIPSYAEIIQLNMSSTLIVNGVPILFTLFPIFMILCIALSIDALLRPEPADRLMGDLARGRARPWLLATAVVLLVVSVLVSLFIVQVFRTARTPEYIPLELSITRIALFDLALESLVAVGTILLGQALVSYEVFTGKVLPRRGFVRQWYMVILLAAGYAAIIGFSLAIQLRPIYSLLLTALLMVIFYALYSWRSFLEREQFMVRLRPFVNSQDLMGQLLGREGETASNASALFQAVCRDVLDAGEAHLLPAGGLSPLVGEPLPYPFDAKLVDFPINTLTDSTMAIIPLEPEHYRGMQWAIPLWGERGKIGTLLLGTKNSGGLYTQEEIEIARAAGERIIDMMAGEQMARRLMMMQRGRLAENRVMDRRTRQALHDETLPTLHTTLLSLSSLPRDNPAVRDAIQSLTAVHQQVADLIHSAHGIPPSVNGTNDFGSLIQSTIQGEFAGEFNSIHWQIGDNLPTLEPLAQEVIVGAVREMSRNAAIHGRGNKPERPLNLSVSVKYDDELIIIITDDGVGLTKQMASTTDLPSGSGGGLTLHSTMLAIIGGGLTVEPNPGGGTCVNIQYRVPKRERRMPAFHSEEN